MQASIITQGFTPEQFTALIREALPQQTPAGPDVLAVELTREQVCTALHWGREKFYTLAEAMKVEPVGKRGNVKLYTLSQFIQLPGAVVGQ